MLSRRSLLALPSLALLRSPARGADLVEAAMVPLGGISVPAQRARLLASPKLGGFPCFLLAFAADTATGQRDLLAVASGGVLLMLEPLIWHGADGATLYTRVSAVPDGQRLRLQRDGTIPRGAGYRREDWTDYLAWNGTDPMLDAPVRPVLAGTWQAALAAQRATTRRLLAVGLRGVPASLLAACPTPDHPPA